MNAINAYFDGDTCIPLEKTDFKKNQRLIIVPLDDFINTDDKKEKSGVSFEEDPYIYSEENMKYLRQSIAEAKSNKVF